MKNYLLATALFIACISGKAQSVNGLWLVASVQVGDQQMTPQAKWMKLSRENQHKGGNGWLQHSSGTYNYDVKNKTLALVDTLGFKDDFGPFNIVLLNDSMLNLTRVEEGEQVKIQLMKISVKPRTLSDQLVGLWETTNTEIADSAPRIIHYRWDHQFSIRAINGNKSWGMWNCHAHRQQVNMAHFGEETRLERWNSSIEGNYLILTNSSNSELIRKYKRIHEFPQ